MNNEIYRGKNLCIYTDKIKKSKSYIRIGGKGKNTMQRTVKGIAVEMAKVTIENGTPTITETLTERYTNTDEITAKKKASKKHIGYAILSVTEFNDLYILDDEIFFKYAKKVEPTEEA